MSPNPALLTWPRPVVSGSILTPHGYHSGSSALSVTIAGATIGTASATRTVLVVVTWNTNGLNRDVTGCTIGGVTATADLDTGNSPGGIAIYRATVPTGATADIVLTWSSTSAFFIASVLSAQTALSVSGTASGTVVVGATTASITPSATVGGVVVAGGTVSRETALTCALTVGIATEIDPSGGFQTSGFGPTPATPHTVTLALSAETTGGYPRLGAVTYTPA